MNAIVLMSFCVGNIIGPETFRDKDAPAYIPAKLTIVVILAIAIVIAVILDLLYSLDNKKRDAWRLNRIELSSRAQLCSSL